SFESALIRKSTFGCFFFFCVAESGRHKKTGAWPVFLCLPLSATQKKKKHPKVLFLINADSKLIAGFDP
ncbi:hypothetical protein QCD79_35005, partial [Pseudomonas quasicaspiana]|nr:hypothetical protein [Pseudomonas quasicaspiana]